MTVHYGEDWSKIGITFDKLKGVVKGESLFRVLSKAAAILLRAAMENAPVRTGFLRASGGLDREDDSPLVGFAAEYAMHVEYG